MKRVRFVNRIASLFHLQNDLNGISSCPECPTQDRLTSDAASETTRWYSTKWAYFAAIFVVLGISAVWASSFGYLTVDSWNYLHLALSIRSGQGCSVGGAYFATFPCGYPMAIALTAPSVDLGALIISSKVTNFILLFIGFFFLMKTFRNVLVPALIIISPLTIGLYLYTWSENLFLLAFCLSLFAISRIAYNVSSRWYSVLLACALIVGCSSRYVFAPFSVVIFIATWIAYGRRTVIRASHAFVAAAIFFVGYEKFNALVTGFPTGMVRIAAPETFVYLMFRFVRQIGKEFILAGVLLLLLLWGLSRPRGWATALRREPHFDTQACRLLALCGAGYLFLAFFLRTVTQYDIYSPRTVSYGLVFVMAALVGMLTRVRRNFYPALPVLAFGVLSLLASQAEMLTRLAGSITNHRYVSSVDALEHYRNSGTDADVIVTLRPPDVAFTMDGYAKLYYPERAVILNIESAPYSIPDTVADMRKKIEKTKARSCVIDFTPFKNRQEFERFVDETFPVGFSFHSFSHVPHVIRRQSLDPALRSHLLATFQTGRYVPCAF
ncbi:conserved membrane hypothetical protein [Paraburkholderia piptadeniae]|uniref:Glycosyltransferase RgtA/B/C/D-like domain-containing protein n=1 Tax=Paraburkholderia piptadeniae TaxID=1701573 RepID=A0A1N7S1H7_9BURK|nr:hypothetical protein [Paraburkholderia piptadeniae]SIT41228.1 conserved membrane hypothetical protein [Paraburkholderia piptadeniae]